MATLPANSINRPIRTGMNGRQVKRIKLPDYRSNQLFVNGVENISSESVEAYKSLRTQVLKAHVSHGICTVAVTSAAHGDGKTLTSFNLACCCAQLRSMPVLLIDADLRTCGLSNLIGPLPAVGLADVLDDQKSFSEAILGTEIENLHVIGAGKSNISPAELLASERWLEFITWAREHFNLVIIDSLPVRAVADFELISAASDGILMVVRALQTPREGVEEALAHIETGKLIGVVWNGAQRPPKYSSYNYSNR